uniref:Ribosomal protein L21e n=1 Tax=Tanacetum cinerariifolium TaxID=118510 RepID=A0A6L2MSH9_TANCI|nr:ribosomal protein L21e [Tanacetum cinerariifolium]
MPAGHGLRSRTRDLFARGFRKKGTIHLSTYLRTYHVGDYVDVKVNGAIHKEHYDHMQMRVFPTDLDDEKCRENVCKRGEEMVKMAWNKDDNIGILNDNEEIDDLVNEMRKIEEIRAQNVVSDCLGSNDEMEGDRFVDEYMDQGKDNVHKTDDSIGTATGCNVLNVEGIKLDNMLVERPTEMDEEGNEIVIFDYDLVATGSMKWSKNLRGQFVVFRMSIRMSFVVENGPW